MEVEEIKKYLKEMENAFLKYSFEMGKIWEKINDLLKKQKIVDDRI